MKVLVLIQNKAKFHQLSFFYFVLFNTHGKFTTSPVWQYALSGIWKWQGLLKTPLHDELGRWRDLFCQPIYQDIGHRKILRIPFPTIYITYIYNLSNQCRVIQHHTTKEKICQISLITWRTSLTPELWGTPLPTNFLILEHHSNSTGFPVSFPRCSSSDHLYLEYFQTLFHRPFRQLFSTSQTKSIMSIHLVSSQSP